MLNFSKMNKAVFLDRDGVVNEIMYHDEKGVYSAMNLEEFKILPRVKEAINEFKKLGFKVIIISNQPGVAFGYIKKENLEKIDKKMIKELKVDAVYNCIHHPKYTGECDCRKPKSGLFEEAIKKFDIDIKNSYNIGDNIIDIKVDLPFKKNFFIGSLRCDLCKVFDREKVRPDYIVKDLYEVVGIIKKLEG